MAGHTVEMIAEIAPQATVNAAWTTGHTACTTAAMALTASTSTPMMTPASWTRSWTICAATGATEAMICPMTGATVAKSWSSARAMLPSAGSS